MLCSVSDFHSTSKQKDILENIKIVAFCVRFRNIFHQKYRWKIVTRRYDDDDDRVWNCGAWFEYILVVVVSSILLIAASVLTIFWVIYYRKGINMDDPKLQFNLHPVLMVGGYITLSGFSILLYRICRCCSHLIVKLCHTFFHACSIPCIVIGFLAVWDSHNQTNNPNFYSLHSWLGCITMGLFVLQFVLGFFSFLILLCCENATYKFRSTMVPIHASFGVVTFMLAIATAVTGLTQKAIFELGNSMEDWESLGCKAPSKE
ncbi:plasma membrane ascorbate-dependent reductase CYBRD1 isoform X3 [Wyeomyia smithii]|uniref:plasma membrane ascorbate-dependent reductase CYBRD1 isoform X3 n=1 Tax=Wyeomyia smithii TaxID=174621 RepID=UPI0024680796|nr:plasma membrane ascorbate-dependent reductase CYBRD1 isoform X3 [Wyeomyia smithii]